MRNCGGNFRVVLVQIDELLVTIDVNRIMAPSVITLVLFEHTVCGRRNFVDSSIRF